MRKIKKQNMNALTLLRKLKIIVFNKIIIWHLCYIKINELGKKKLKKSELQEKISV